MGSPCRARLAGPSSPLYALAALLSLAGVAAFSVDLLVLDWVRELRLGGDLRRFVTLSEFFAHGLGAFTILLAVLVLDPERRWCAPRILACVFVPGLVVNLIKSMVARLRPRSLEFTSVWDTFVGWGPILEPGRFIQLLDNSLRSFPSGHSATAAGLAAILSVLYPRGTLLFVGLAAVALFQRLHEYAHYLSDTLIGASLGCFVAALCLDRRGPGGWFDRLEGRRPRTAPWIQPPPGTPLHPPHQLGDPP